MQRFSYVVFRHTFYMGIYTFFNNPSTTHYHNVASESRGDLTLISLNSFYPFIIMCSFLIQWHLLMDAKKLLSDLFPRPKPPTLPAEVIEAVRLYNKPVHQDVIKDWLKKDDKNAVDSEGRSVLHHATLAGRSTLVSFFLGKGVKKELEDSRGYTPLILAAQEVHGMTPEKRHAVLACMKQLLVAGARVVSSGVFPQVAVNVAALNGDLETLELLERHGAAIDEDIMGTPLWWASSSKDAEKNTAVIAYLESKGCTSRMGASM